MDNATKAMTEISVAGITVSAFLDVLPAVTAIVGVVYYSIKIWESDTVRGWTGRL